MEQESGTVQGAPSTSPAHWWSTHGPALHNCTHCTLVSRLLGPALLHSHHILLASVYIHHQPDTGPRVGCCDVSSRSGSQPITGESTCLRC